MQKKTKIVSIIIFSILMIALSSCKMKAEQKSLTSTFELIDSYIADGDFKQALKELKDVEKKVYDSWAYIGIYKRYIQIGEEDRAEKLLKKGIRKNSHNEELSAVYADFLLRHNRIDEAAKRAEVLRGGKYGSLYSEAVLRIEQKNNPSSENPEYYKDPKFYEIYYDAFKARNNPVWLHNCALYYLVEGNYEGAAKLSPGFYSTSSDAYFWAMVLYDATWYYDCAEACETGKSFLDNPQLMSLQVLKSGIQPDLLDLTALESDAYLKVSEVEKAQEARSTLFARLDDYENPTDEQGELLRLLAVNSAIYADYTDDDVTTTDMLKYVVERWPDYNKGLALYSDYAYKSNIMREEDMEVQDLRRSGLKTLEMEQYDNRKKLSTDDAQRLIDDALENGVNPELSLIKLDLKYKLDSTYTQKQKIADIWNLLESTITEDSKYKLPVVEYALSFLIKADMYDDAYTLFYKYISTTYSFEVTENFWIQLECRLGELDHLMAEFAAYFAARQKLYDETIRFYEFCVYKDKDTVSPYVSNPSIMNLADIYFSTGKRNKAIDLYGEAAGREKDNYRKSEIFYRLACVYVANGDKKSALRALEYSNSIYPGNARSVLLKDKLNNEEIIQ